MKRILLLAWALTAALAAAADEPRIGAPERRDARRLPGLEFSDSLQRMVPWSPLNPELTPLEVRSVAPMSSVVVIRQKDLPRRVTVLDNNSLRLSPRFGVSNGQAWNWSPYPDAHLDARTLSFPMSRR